MITITYPANSRQEVSILGTRLNNLVFKYQLVENNDIETPQLTDGKKHAEGISSIETYIDELEATMNGWYEDRCDKYEFEEAL